MANIARRKLQDAPRIIGDERRSPYLEDALAEHAAVLRGDELLECSKWNLQGHPREVGLPGGDIDRRARQYQAPHLAGKPRRKRQRHPAALAQADEIDRRPELVHGDVEIGEIIVDGQEPHLRPGRAPVRDVDAADAALVERLDHAVAAGEIGDGRAMQGERGADEGGDAARAGGEIAQLHGAQFEAHSMGRGPGGLALPGRLRAGHDERGGNRLPDACRHQRRPREQAGRKLRRLRDFAVLLLLCHGRN